MANWIAVGDLVVNMDNVNYVRRISSTVLELNMSGDAVLEVTESMAANVWNWVQSERLSFYDTQTQTRDFSGT